MVGFSEIIELINDGSDFSWFNFAINLMSWELVLEWYNLQEGNSFNYSEQDEAISFTL